MNVRTAKVHELWHINQTTKSKFFQVRFFHGKVQPNTSVSALALTNITGGSGLKVNLIIGGRVGKILA